MKTILIIAIVWIILMAIILSLFVRKPIDSETRKMEDEEQMKYLEEYRKKKELKNKR